MGKNGRDGEDGVSGTFYYDIAYLPTYVTRSDETEPARSADEGQGRDGRRRWPIGNTCHGHGA